MTLRRRFSLFLAVLLVAVAALPLVLAKPAKTTYTPQMLNQKSGPELLSIIAKMDVEPQSRCGWCFKPDVGPEDPTCGDCHLACAFTYRDPQYPEGQCVDCSDYFHGYYCDLIIPNAEGGVTLTGDAAKTIFTLPSVLYPGKKVLLRYAGMQKYGSRPSHPREADDLRRWYIASAGNFKKCSGVTTPLTRAGE